MQSTHSSCHYQPLKGFWRAALKDARLPVRRLKERWASTRYGVSLLERSLRIALRSVLLSGVVAIKPNQCPMGECVNAGPPVTH